MSSCILSIDIPDPDNFLMALRILKSPDYNHVHILVASRPVSFGSLPYGSNFEVLQDKLDEIEKGNGSKRLIHTVTSTIEEWVQTLDVADRGWFYVDEGFRNPDVIEDTMLYLDVSRLRLIAYLRTHHIDSSHYTLYTNQDLKGSTIQPGMRHAFHCPDYTFGFSPTLKRYYEKAIQEAKPDDGSDRRSTQLRTKTRRYCGAYVEMQKAELEPNEVKDYQELERLVENKDITEPHVYVGGPFTDIAIIAKKIQLGPIYAMGGFVLGRNNKFPNQFNFHVDLNAARTVLNMAESGDLDLTLVPTESVKGTPYQIEREVFDREIGPLSPKTVELCNQYYRPNEPIIPYDLLAAMPKLWERLFPSGTKRRVKVQDAEDILKFEPIEGLLEGPGIKMFWVGLENDGTLTDETRAYMETVQGDFLVELKNTVRPYRRIDQSQLQDWFLEPLAFLRKLQEVDGFAMGPVCTAVLLGEEISRHQDGYGEALTVWMPPEKEQVLRQWLLNDAGYVAAGNVEGLYSRLGRYTIDTKSMDAEELQKKGAVSILDYVIGLECNTAETTFLTGEYLVCPYPELTWRKRCAAYVRGRFVFRMEGFAENEMAAWQERGWTELTREEHRKDVRVQQELAEGRRLGSVGTLVLTWDAAGQIVEVFMRSQDWEQRRELGGDVPLPKMTW